jgi:hypothetical protein
MFEAVSAAAEQSTMPCYKNWHLAAAAAAAVMADGTTHADSGVSFTWQLQARIRSSATTIAVVVRSLYSCLRHLVSVTATAAITCMLADGGTVHWVLTGPAS